LRHDPRDILRDLVLTPTLYAESDGFHKCDVFLNVEPPEGFEKLPRATLIAIGERMPLELWVRDPYGRDGKVVWMDEELVSLEYANGGYIVWKRVELP
jgi:hypothetical protein